MFHLSTKQLEELGATTTTREIRQQPELWKETHALYMEKKDAITAFLHSLSEKHDKLRIIMTGAGTSAYVGDTVYPYLKQKIDGAKWELLSVPTTTLVSNPYQFFKQDIPTVLVSFARSGNSPESVATVNMAGEMIQDFYQITITCAPEGQLAKNAHGDENNLLLLMPERSNDQGFAMTGSYTCMTLTALLVFDTLSEGEEGQIVSTLVQMGESVIDQAGEIEALVDLDFNRIIYLGSGSFEGLSREAQLKILELTAGKVTTSFDSSLGFRHGPKSFVDENSLAIMFVSNNMYTRKYDLDMLNEMKEDGIAANVIAVEVEKENGFEGETFSFSGAGEKLADAYLVLPFVMVAQTIALLASVKVKNKPDDPSPSGTVNRVVKGVTIYDYHGEV